MEFETKPKIRYVMKKSIPEKNFPDKLKLTKLKSTFTKRNEWNRNNHQEVSLPCMFSKAKPATPDNV